MIHPLVKLLASDKPKVDAALAIVGGRVAKTSKQNLLVEGDRFKAVLVYALGDQITLSEIRVYPETELGVVFKDITKIFGEGRAIVESKTSTVVFDCSKIGIDNRVYVSAHLLDPPKYPLSHVLSLTIRHEAVDRTPR